MFNRWRQEKFFRYLRSRFGLDALDTYTIVDDDPVRTVPNPAKKDAATRTKALKTIIASGEATLGRYAHIPALAQRWRAAVSSARASASAAATASATSRA